MITVAPTQLERQIIEIKQGIDEAVKITLLDDGIRFDFLDDFHVLIDLIEVESTEEIIYLVNRERTAFLQKQTTAEPE